MIHKGADGFGGDANLELPEHDSTRDSRHNFVTADLSRRVQVERSAKAAGPNNQAILPPKPAAHPEHLHHPPVHCTELSTIGDFLALSCEEIALADKDSDDRTNYKAADFPSVCAKCYSDRSQSSNLPDNNPIR